MSHCCDTACVYKLVTQHVLLIAHIYLQWKFCYTTYSFSIIRLPAFATDKLQIVSNWTVTFYFAHRISYKLIVRGFIKRALKVTHLRSFQRGSRWFPIPVWNILFKYFSSNTFISDLAYHFAETFSISPKHLFLKRNFFKSLLFTRALSLDKNKLTCGAINHSVH